MTLKPFTNHDYRDPNLRYGELVLCRKINFGKNSNLVRFVPIEQPKRHELLEFLTDIHRKFGGKPRPEPRNDAPRGKHVDFLA